MTLDLMKYKYSLEIVRTFIEHNPNLSIKDLASRISQLTYLPIIVTYYYIGHIKGFNAEILNSIHSLTEFYNIDIIEGIDELFNEQPKS